MNRRRGQSPTADPTSGSAKPAKQRTFGAVLELSNNLNCRPVPRLAQTMILAEQLQCDRAMPEPIRRSGSADGYRPVAVGAGVGLAKALDEAPLPAKGKTSCGGFGLTRRELEVISKLAAGGTNRRIAGDLAISGETVKSHLAHIFDKLGFSTRLEVALFAVHHQLIDRGGFDGTSPRLRNASPGVSPKS